MAEKRDATTGGLLADVVAPVSTVEDARATGRALAAHSPGTVTVLHVVEKGEGVPDKTPVEQSEEAAEDMFAAFRESLPSATTELRYGRDVVEAVHAFAADRDASAVAFVPREGNRLAKLLAGDRAYRLVTEASCPVVALPGDEQA